MVTLILNRNKYKTEKYLDEIKSKVNEFDFITLKNPTLEELHNVNNLSPILSKNKVIFVYLLSDNIKENLIFFNSVAKTTDLYIIEEDLLKTSVFYKEMLKTFKVMEFVDPTPLELKKFVNAIIESKKLRVKADALERFLQLTGNDLYSIENELNKFEDDSTVTIGDIADKTNRIKDINAFEIIDGLFSGSKQVILGLTELLNDGFDYIHFINLLIWQVRHIIQVKQLVTEGLPKNEVINRLGISPYTFGKMEKQIKRYSLDDLLTMYIKLENCDLVGKINPRSKMTALYEFLECFK